ncbi:unnamed protein product [Cyclocybe aegerita]|uniref:Uncharacterized protein n=1 Tax=Cyclocybe aegerita TaxID=1973307 RepID=A0A8S0WM48_CYCAE|nr:unnamed protein product [Cyclocybe aegerita]
MALPPPPPPPAGFTTPASTSTSSDPCDDEDSAVRLMNWQNSGSELKSNAELKQLVDKVILHPKFDIEHFCKFNPSKINQQQDAADVKSLHLDGFQETSVSIEVPSGDKNTPPHFLDVPGLHYHNLTSNIRATFASPIASRFHLTPFKLFHNLPRTTEQETTERETTEQETTEHEANEGETELHETTERETEEHETTERVFSEVYNSDAFLQEHEKVQSAPVPPDDPECKHEKVVAALMFWSDSTHLADFRTAKLWLIYMFFGNLSKHCACEWIYKKAKPIGGAKVEQLLKPTSSVPTINAFIDRLGESFPLNQIFVIDLMHEFELGVWKSLFTHLIRILYAVAPDGRLVTKFDKRFRDMPTFGTNGTIRCFATNASEMKKLAARDFEDLLQCSIPAFEDLLDEPYNTCLMKLLYHMAEWHAFAKLRQHTETTLTHLEGVTTELGKLLGDPDLRYYILESQSNAIDVYRMLATCNDDPAYKKFLPTLQDYLLAHLKGCEFDGDDQTRKFTHEERNAVHILGGKIYSVKTCQLFYTSYDLQRSSDTINPTSHPDIFIKAPPDPENPEDPASNTSDPYWYGQVLGIYHAKVNTSLPEVWKGSEIRWMYFLWVRWLGTEPNYCYGFMQGHLPMVSFVPSMQDGSFGFLDPSHIIRGCHLMPAYALGRTHSLLPVSRSDARCLNQDEEDDWTNFYVNVFVDRDMVMQHFGGGIGHLSNAPSRQPVCSTAEGNGPSQGEEDEDEEEQVPEQSGGATVAANDSKQREQIHSNNEEASEDEQEDDEQGQEGEGEGGSEDEEDSEDDEDDNTDKDRNEEEGEDSEHDIVDDSDGYASL